MTSLTAQAATRRSATSTRDSAWRHCRHVTVTKMAASACEAAVTCRRCWVYTDCGCISRRRPPRRRRRRRGTSGPTRRRCSTARSRRRPRLPSTSSRPRSPSRFCRTYTSATLAARPTSTRSIVTASATYWTWRPMYRTRSPPATSSATCRSRSVIIGHRTWPHTSPTPSLLSVRCSNLSWTIFLQFCL